MRNGPRGGGVRIHTLMMQFTDASRERRRVGSLSERSIPPCLEC
jgi:hypothetical protein